MNRLNLIDNLRNSKQQNDIDRDEFKESLLREVCLSGEYIYDMKDFLDKFYKGIDIIIVRECISELEKIEFLKENTLGYGLGVSSLPAGREVVRNGGYKMYLKDKEKLRKGELAKAELYFWQLKVFWYLFFVSILGFVISLLAYFKPN